MSLRGVLVPAIVLLGMSPVGRAQQQPPAQRATETVREGVTAVLVDVVVRDRKGQPVRDLTPADFQVFEDGAPQTIGSFTPIFAGEPAAPLPAPSAPAPAPPGAATNAAVGSPAPTDRGPAVTALVFDRLSPESQRRAVQAAEAYFGAKGEAASYFGVFSLDLALTPYSPFTRNTRLLKEALARMEKRAAANFNSPEQKQQKADADQRAASASQAQARAEGAAGPGASQAMGTAPGEAILAQMQAKMIQDFEVMERDEQGYATTNGLFAVINALRRVPGRKSLVLFSEGIAIPPAVERLFRGVIDAANRANVSIYTIDAAGLRGESSQAAIRDQVNDAAKRGINTGYASSNTRNDAPLTQALEQNEAVLRQDPHTGLGQLAQETGGLLFENTNNLRQGFDRIETDLRNYYLIGYTPTNDAFDGRFRMIEVKVRRPGVTVAARKGYFAVRDTGLPINPWEAPALGAIESKPVPNAFPVRAAALLFPERERPGLVPIVVEVKTTPLTFQPSEDGKTYSSDFSVLVQFVDERNQIVRKVSQHYEVTGPIAEIERAKQGDVIFYREPELPSGVYTMESVVYDAPSGKSSVRFSTVEVPKTDPDKLRMSSLILVKRTEKVAANERRPNNPLLVNDVVLYPNLGEPVSKSSKELGFYFAAYPAKNGPSPEGILQLLQNGTAVAQLPMSLPAANASGRIQQAGRLPLDQLAPGTYELRAVVKQGTDQVFRSTMLRLTD